VKSIHEQIVKLGTDLPYVIYVDHTCRHIDLSGVLWMFLANFDPDKDFYFLKVGSGFVCGFDGTMKTMSEDGLPTSRPNVLVMNDEVIKKIDELWADIFPDVLYESPSLMYKKITLREGYLYEK
jgi:4-hydroxy-3-polyprenylbenzoate decarboxylase